MYFNIILAGGHTCVEPRRGEASVGFKQPYERTSSEVQCENTLCQTNIK